jgi:hypothetical protein
MSRWSDAFRALTPTLTHETQHDTCVDARAVIAQVSTCVPCVAAADRANGSLHELQTKRGAGEHVSPSVSCVRPPAGKDEASGATDLAPPRRRLTDQQQPSAGHVAGLQAAALQRPPSWSDATALPSTGAWCSCCRGRRWWSEGRDPKGWRCWACHPPGHLPAEAVREAQT